MANGGYNALNFGGQFAQGFANALLRNRDRQDRLAREESDKSFRQFQALNPAAFAAAQASGDWTGYENFLYQYFPELKKEQKKSGMSFMDLGPLLQSVNPDGTSAGAQAPIPARAAPGTPAASMPAPAPTPTYTAEATPPTSLFGIRTLSREEQLQQGITETTQTEEGIARARVAVARRLLPILQQVDPNVTLRDALNYVAKERLLLSDAEKAASQPFYGVDRESIAQTLFNKSFANLSVAERETVMDEEQRLLVRGESANRALGTAEGRFQGPADLSTAQQTGVEVGTSAAAVAGQRVPTAAENERRDSTLAVRDQLMHIRDDLLVGALPGKEELGGLAPGAAYALRRRLPEYRDKVASLESAVNNIVNVMARSVAQQRGTQTERDALRAEAAIVQIRDAVLTGDTLESATARINESLRVLEGILGRLPNRPVPNAQPGAGTQQPPPQGAAGPEGTQPLPTGGVNAVQNDQGEWVLQFPDAPVQ